MQPNKMKLKRKETIQVIIAAFAAAVAAFSAFGGKTVLRPVPRPALLERMVNGPDIIGIVHWGLNTYTDREWGYGDVDPKLLNPVSFDADQIVGAAKAGGIDRKKIGTIISNNLRKQRKERPSYDERSSKGKAGCGKSARTVR